MKNTKVEKYKMFEGIYPMTWELVLADASDDKIFASVTQELDERTLEKRSRTTLRERFKKIDETGSYRLCDLVFNGDKIVIKSRPNMLTSSLTLEYSSTLYGVETEVLSISNCAFAWKLLNNINKGCGTEVFNQVWDEEGETSKEVPFLASRPFKHRQERGLFNKTNEYGLTV